jgi:hypothetical protein
MGLWQRLFGKPQTSNAFWSRAPSFCFVVFQGDVRDALPSLFRRAGYTQVLAREGTGSFGELIAERSEAGADPETVLKAFFVTNGTTVLVDKEMVIATDEELLSLFCREQGTQAATALWERVSETVEMLEISAAGLTRRSACIQGQPDATQQEPRPELTARPDAQGLLAALNQAGFAPPPFEQRVEATVLTLASTDAP